MWWINKDACCGCEACKQICSMHCIKMVMDTDGFFYPVVDKKSCINCHQCEMVCPVLGRKKDVSR